MTDILWKPKEWGLLQDIKDKETDLWSETFQAKKPKRWWEVNKEEPEKATLAYTKKPKEEPISVPFWQRALNVFTAPFEWVDEYIIRPSLSLAGTEIGFVSEVERLPGEDFWEWKKRSWAGWESPGFDLNVPWSDEPLRIDLRGVMEIAPWLLIPGAGQVGGGVRAARGIAGVLGKVSRPLGYAVEYSPWGLVEKTAGAAIKSGIRLGGAVGKGVTTRVGEKLFGKYEPPPISPVVSKLTRDFKEVIMPARKELEPAIKAMRIEQEKSIQKIYARARRGEITMTKASEEAAKARGYSGGVKQRYSITPENLARRRTEALAEIEARVKRGEISESSGKALVTRLEKNPKYRELSQYSKEEVEELLTMIDKAAESGFVEVGASQELRHLFLTGEIPFPYFVKQWAKVFGDDFAKAVGRFKELPKGTGNMLVDALNLPRAVIASTDLSATARQGLILGLLHPTQVPKWFGRQIKAFFSEKLSYEMDDALRQRPLFDEFVRNGGYIAPLREAMPTAAEELFMSNLARRVPLVRKSERAFITYLNEARMTSFEAAYNTMKAQGATAEHFKVLADFINMASGRGTLPKSLEKYSPLLNTVLFSPRLQMATLQLPRQIGRMLLSGNPYMRKEAAKALVTFVGGGASLLGLLKATGNKVELDPRSGDFGKIKIGETRLDIWRGYLQYTRFVAQMLTGERKSAYGNMNKAERDELSYRFLQSKSSPAFGLMVDLLRGENYMGKPIFNDTTGFVSTVKERIIPLALQDVIDAMEQGGVNKAWVAAPAMLGVGALTYVNDYVKLKEKIARDLGYESWDDIDPKKQIEIQNRNAELQAATIKFDRDVMGTAWGDWRNAGNTIEDIFKENVEVAAAQYRTTGDGYKFRERVGDAFTARRGGYTAREKELRFEDIVKRLNVEDTAEALVSLGPEQLAIKVYNDALYGDDMYDEFGEYRFDEADTRKAQLRQQLGEEMFNYVEEFRGEKYAEFPEEFQLLRQARIVMKPYWDIERQVLSMYGISKKNLSMHPRVQRLITKMRKNLRITNPEINRFYMMFYARQS